MAEWLESADVRLRLHLATMESDIPWSTKALQELARYVDASKYTTKVCMQMVHEYIKAGGRIKVKENENDPTFGVQTWYGVTIDCDGVELFIKFKFQCNSYQRIVVLGAHK